MSSGAGDARKRPGFMDSFRAALTPPPLPPDDGKPLVRPTAVTVASILAILGGAIFVFLGTTSIVTLDNQVNAAVSEYKKSVDTCTSQFGGIGDAATAPANATAQQSTDVESCKNTPALTDEMISNYRSSNMIFGAIFIVLGLVAAAGGWFLRSGNRWARFAVVGIVLINVIFTLLLGVSNVLILGASLMLIAAIMMCFIGKGGVYFARVKARRAG